MSASTPISSSLCHSFLAVHGATLKRLLNKAKSMEGSSSSIYEELEEVTKQLLRDLRVAQELFINEALVCVIAKIEDTLGKFIKLDTANATRYQELAEEVRGLRFQRQSSHAVDSSWRLASVFDRLPEPEPEPEPTYQNLDEEKKQYLSWFCLFPDGKALSKRELLYWWVGMGLIPTDSDSDGGKKHCYDMLCELTAGDFIERPVVNNKAFNVYRMRSGVRSKLMEQAVHEPWTKKPAKQGSFSVIHVGDHNTSMVEPEKVEALVNISEKSLKTGRFGWLSKMKNAKVVHLGTWGWGDDKKDEYIVVDYEAELGKALEHLEKVKCLILGGISGIVNLPDSVCKLQHLTVLDLRACNNLELLPSEIGSLKRLTHLDLSECYLLDHIPKGIAALTELIVLKGFVITTDPDPGSPNDDIASCALFSDLSGMRNLRTLTVRTRRMNFPTRGDSYIFIRLGKLTKLRIAWVGTASDAQSDDPLYSDLGCRSLQKLELEGVTDETVSRSLVSVHWNSTLEKLYIKGGKLENIRWLEYFRKLKVLRLRYLPNLSITWRRLRGTCPSLTRLEVFECPNLMMFPCDEDGVWQRDDDNDDFPFDFFEEVNRWSLSDTFSENNLSLSPISPRD